MTAPLPTGTSRPLRGGGLFATLGSGGRWLLLFVGAWLVAAGGAQAQVHVPSTNGFAATNRFPYGTFFGFERSAMIYPAAEINAPAGSITTVGFYLNAMTASVATPVRIYLKSVPGTAFAAPTTVAAEEAGATLVVGATLPANAFVANTWVTATLSTPFAYNGTDNLEVIVETNFGGVGAGNAGDRAFRLSTTAGGSFQVWATDNTPPAGTGTLSFLRPNIRLQGLLPNCASATASALSVSGITTTSATVSFTPQASSIASYTITTTPASSIYTAAATATSQALTGLMPGVAYTANVVSNCAAGGTSNAATVAFATPANCTAPTALGINTVTANSANFTFAPVATGVSSYTVTTTPVSGSYTVAASPVALTGLVPGTTYTATIVSNCAAGGTSGAASSAAFTTPTPLANFTTARNAGIAYASIQGTGTAFGWQNATNTDDNVTTTVPLTAGSAAAGVTAFAFNYLGLNVQGFQVSTNGWLTFNTANTNFNGPATRDNNLGSNAIGLVVAPFWEDLVLQGNANNATALAAAKIKYQVSGTAPNRTLTVEWAGMEPFGTPGPNLNFQAVLTETANTIEYRYGSMLAFDGSLNYSYTYSVGLNGRAATTTNIYLAQDVPNANYFLQTNASSGQSNPPNAPTAAQRGNSLSIVPACNTSLVFTPSATFAANLPPAAALSANDNPAGAIALVLDTGAPTEFCTVYSSAGATASGGIAACAAATPGNADDDVWFKFVVPTASDVTVTLRSSGAYDGVLQLFGATSGGALGAALDCRNATGAGLTERSANVGLAAGTYFVRVYEAGTGAGYNGTFALAAFVTPTPPANDDCAGAIVLNVSSFSCVPVVGSTSAATASAGIPVCTATPDDDVWYQFTTGSTAVNDYNIVLQSSSGFNGVFQLLGGPCGSLTTLGCRNSSGTGGTETAVTNNLAANTTYFLRVYHAGSGAGTGDFTLCMFRVCNPPDRVAVSSSGPTSANVTFTNGGSGGFTVTATPTAGPGTAVVVGSGTTGAAPGVALAGLVVGTSYSIVVQGDCASTATSTAIGYTALLPNDDPAGAVALPLAAACTPTGGSNVGATTTTPSGYTNPGCGPATAPLDVWYRFATAASGAGSTGAVVSVSGTAAGQVRVFSASSSAGPFAPVGCADGGASNTPAPPLALAGLTAGTTYYVSVSGYGAGDAPGPFTICVTPCSPPTGVAADAITSTTANATFAGNGSGNTSFTATATPATGPAVTAAGTASPLVLTGLLPGTVYRLVVAGNCGPTGASAAATFTTAVAPPANDQCSGAITIACGQTRTGSTTGATTTNDPAAACGTRVTGEGGVFYSFVGTGGDVTVSTCAGPTSVSGDTKLLVLSGTCAALTCVDGNDDSAGCGNTLASEVTFASVLGTQYYFFVQGFSEAVDFGLSVSCAAVPVCNAPTGAGVGSITATTARVSFTPSGTALTYTVTATPPSGPAVTASGSASPLNLTGLSPGTAYAVRVVSNCASGVTSAAATATFSTLTGPLPDLTVSSAQAVSGAYNNVTVTGTGTATLAGPLSVAGALLVQAGGSLVSNCQVVSGSGSFTLADGATLAICSADGIGASGSTGTVQVTGARSYGFDASYFYNGTGGPQATGNGLPARTRNLSVNNPSGLTLTQATSVAQVLTLTAGNLLTNGHTFTLLSDASTGTALVVNAGTGTVVGDVTVQRAIDARLNPGLGYRHYSSPVASAPFGDLATPGFTPVLNAAYNSSASPYAVVPFPNVFGYNEARLGTVANDIPDAFSKGWFVPTGPNLLVGRGYTVNIDGSQVVDFVGTLNNGPLRVALTRSGGADGGWGFVGNPYPAPLNYGNVTANDRPNLDAALYVFASTGTYAGSYRSYANGIGGNPVIPSSQGFFMRVSAGQTSGTLNFNNTQRETAFSNATSFQRPAADPRPVLALALANAAGSLADAAHVYFEAGAAAAADASFDALKMPNPSGLELATLAGADALAINGLPPLGAAPLPVPVALRVPAAGRYTLRVDELANFGGATVALRDALTGTSTALVPGTVVTLSLSAGGNNGRLTLVFNPAGGPLATAGRVLAAQLGLYPNPAHGRFTLAVPPVAGATSALATLHNALGQVVSIRTLALSKAGTAAEFSTLGLPTGVYALTLRIGNATAMRRVVVE